MKNIIITGAGNGIGAYLAKELIDKGYNVTALDLDLDFLQSIVSNQNNLYSLKCDVRDSLQVKNCINDSYNKYGSIDCAIHNACLCTFDSIENTNIEIYNEVFDVNYIGAVRLIKSVLPYMKEQGSGKIILTSSGVGVTGFANISPYASSKGALESLAKCMQLELKKYRITCHICHPPLTRTKSSKPLGVPDEFKADPQIVARGIAKRINKKKFILCHSALQMLTTKICYLTPLKMGKMLDTMMNKSK